MSLPTSDWTEPKQEAFRQMIRTYAAIARAIQVKRNTGRWFYFELTAGPGRLTLADGRQIAGSPLLALDAFRKHELQVDCRLVEWVPEYAVSLREALGAEDWGAGVQYEIHELDHALLLTRPQCQCGDYGLLYFDGLGGDRYPGPELQAWLRRNWAHDVLGMASGCGPKRMGRERLDLLLRTAATNNGRRRYAYVSETQGPWEWVFSLVTGWPPLATKLSGAGLQLHEQDSPAGRRVLDKVGTTAEERKARDEPELLAPEYTSYDEYLRHPRFRAVRREAMERTNWRCERCGKPASEVHHLRYPPWGTFDVPENLEPLCHECHCKEHGKDD